MSSVIPFRDMFGIRNCKMTKFEEYLIESALFLNLYKHLKEIFRKNYKEYFSLMKYSKDMEENMLNENYTKFLINDIIDSGEYTISGIAAYTDIPEDFIIEITYGNHINISVQFFQKIVELHMLSRAELYKQIIGEVIDKYITK